MVREMQNAEDWQKAEGETEGGATSVFDDAAPAETADAGETPASDFE